MARSIDLHGVPETMLQTLYARAKASRQHPELLMDRAALDIVAQLDYDFTTADRDRAMCSGVFARTLLLDEQVEQFLAAHPSAVVVNLACGLDTRCYRVKGQFSRWYNLDLPEAMTIRQRFFAPTGTIRQIACSALDEAWASQVQQTDEPVLVLIEGLTMYLTQEQVQTLFAILSRRFAHATVLVETMCPWVVKHFKEKSIEGSQAKFTWGPASGQAMQALVPPFLCQDEISLVEGMKRFIPLYHLLGRLGPVRRISNHILVLHK